MAKIHIAEDHTLKITQIISPSSMGIGGLYLGNFQAINNKEILKKHKITAILSIMSEKQISLISAKTTHLQIKIDDSPFENITVHFSNSFEFISKYRKTGNVFVHCMAGISRSATIVIAYLMKLKKYTFNHALTKVKKRRNIVNPNKGFIHQLQVFQKSLEKECKQKLK